MIQLITACVIETRAMLREGLVSLLERNSYEIVGNSAPVPGDASGASAIAPMLVILGNLPADEAVTTAASIRIQWPTAKVAYLFDYLSSADYQNLLASEINGCVPLHASSATLLHLLRQLIDTDHFRVMIMRADASSTARAPTVQPSLEADLSQEDDTVHRVSARRTSWGLSGREDEILRFLAQGQSNKVIARACGVADATIKVHMKSIFRKLGVGNRTQAALRAMEWAADKAVDLVPAYSDPPIVEMA